MTKAFRAGRGPSGPKARSVYRGREEDGPGTGAGTEDRGGGNAGVDAGVHTVSQEHGQNCKYQSGKTRGQRAFALS